MQQTTSQKSQRSNLSFNVDKYPLVELTRKFSAPVELVWEAWTSPELLRQWWGPENFSCPDARVDLRVGGKSILAMKDPQGKVQYSGGEYEEVVINERLVSTDRFMDKAGNPMNANEAGMPGDWPDVMRVTIDFKKTFANQCQINIVHEGIPKAMHDDCVSGWSSSLDKLQRLVEKKN